MPSAIDTLAPVAGLAVTLSEGVLSVNIDRPESLNSVTTGVLNGIADAMEHAAADPQVKVVRLGGSGRGFCSGAGMGADDLADAGPGSEIIAAANRAILAIAALPRPVVAVVHGPAAGVGVSLALACDIVLASEKAFFMLAFTRVGLMPDGGASALVAAAVGRIRAMRMALLAERVPAAEAVSWGLATAVYPAQDFEVEVGKVISKRSASNQDARETWSMPHVRNAREIGGQLAALLLVRMPDLTSGRAVGMVAR